MKRWRTILLVLFISVMGMSACQQDTRVELPALTVGETMEATIGAHSWTVKQGLGKAMTQETSTAFPLDYPNGYPSLPIPADGMISLEWETPPDAYSVSYWKEEVWDDDMEAVMTKAQEKEPGFFLPEGDAPAIVTVQAEWKQKAFRPWYGQVEYVFQVIPNP